MECLYAARHIASQVAKLCSSKTVGLLVSEEFYKEWHEHEYVELVDAGYKKPPKTMNIMEHRVIICTISHCLTPKMAAFASRTTTVVFDEASQVVNRIVSCVFLTVPRLTRSAGVGLSRPYASNGDSVTGEALSVR